MDSIIAPGALLVGLGFDSRKLTFAPEWDQEAAHGQEPSEPPAQPYLAAFARPSVKQRLEQLLHQALVPFLALQLLVAQDAVDVRTKDRATLRIGRLQASLDAIDAIDPPLRRAERSEIHVHAHRRQDDEAVEPTLDERPFAVVPTSVAWV